MPVLFSELNSDWRPVPEWANFLIRLGYGWPTKTGQRGIALVSMPCDSPAAYLIGLGSLISGTSFMIRCWRVEIAYAAPYQWSSSVDGNREACRPVLDATTRRRPG
jgi:hypothetical protein